MKRNPKTKIKVGDSTPVMHCQAIRRRKMNGSDAWGVGVTLVPKGKIDIEEMGAITQQRCTVTQSDVIAAWSMLEVIIAEALANGHRVELGELGSLSIDVSAKRLKEYIAQGVMEHIPYSRGYYRPTEGNFGRES